MKNRFSYRVTFGGCETRKPNCFLIINDLPDEVMSRLYLKSPDNVDQEMIEILNKRRNFWIKQSETAARQKFLGRNLYLNIFNKISLIADTKRLEVSPYITENWTQYQNLWNYNDSYRIVGHPHAGFIIITPLDLKKNILENYDVRVKMITNKSMSEVLPAGSTLLVFPDARTIKTSAFVINGIDHSSAVEYDPDSMGQNVTVSSKNMCFLILLIPKEA